jgi:hypothetical protein
MSQYVKECIFCKAKIKMSNDKNNKWLPYNENGSKHDCKNKKDDTNKINGVMDANVKEKQRKTFTLEAVVKKLQSVGVTVNLSKLMEGEEED